MAGKTFGVGLLGCGIVGGGVEKILREQRELLRQRTGIDFELRHVVVKDREAFPPNHADLPMSTDANAAIDDPKTDVIVELIGGTNVANTFIERALKLGKPVVTANKSLLAARGAELFALARQHKSCIGFEASCGGGIPIIHALLNGLIANDIHALLGIVNGTCNFILTQMTKMGWSYDQALKEAQKQGFAEANPTLDVSGKDAAAKLAILGGLAFNVRIAESDIHVEGIDKLQAQDIGFAKELGYVIKLLAIAEKSPADKQQATGNKQHATSISLRVHPTLVHQSDMLAEVSGSFNAISVYGHALGHALFYGRGAGRTPTASAIVADLIGIALGTTAIAFANLKVFPDVTPHANVLPMDALMSRYYVRLMATDAPGVLAEVTNILGRHNISLSAVLQRESNGGQHVPVVITTHLAKEGEMRAALKEIDALKTIAPKSVCLRIIDQPKEFNGA
jgi:homoserine dehydrogenase